MLLEARGCRLVCPVCRPARTFTSAASLQSYRMHTPPPGTGRPRCVASPACGRGRARAARPGEGRRPRHESHRFRTGRVRRSPSGKAALSARPEGPHPAILRMSDLSRKRERHRVRKPAAGLTDRSVHPVARKGRGTHSFCWRSGLWRACPTISRAFCKSPACGRGNKPRPTRARMRRVTPVGSQGEGG
jgi:hypothetical protein